jgi:hypothetical protein
MNRSRDALHVAALLDNGYGMLAAGLCWLILDYVQ